MSNPISAPRRPATALADSRLGRALREALEESRALHPVLLDLRSVSAWVDGFAVCHGSSARHMQTIAEKVITACEAVTRAPLHIEGTPASGWLLVDAGDLVAHIFDREHRDFYDLERLWGDVPAAPLSETETDDGTATDAAD